MEVASSSEQSTAPSVMRHGAKAPTWDQH